MGKLVVSRLLQAIPLVVTSTIFIFVAVSVSGDPLNRYRQPNVPQSTLDAKARELGLDQPLHERYWHWITGALHGDFGLDSAGRPVGPQLLDRAVVSLRLIALAIVISILVAVVVGFFAAIRRGRLTDRVLAGTTILFLTAPEFWTAVIVKQGAIWLNQRTGTNTLATVGSSTPGIETEPLLTRLGDHASHLILPTIVLILGTYPLWALYQRAAMLEVMDSDYVMLARAKGLSYNRAMVKHGLRNALMPLITMIALRIPWIIGGLVVIESIFGWQGLGTLLVTGIQRQDTNVVLAFLLLSSALITILNLAADICHRLLDPRIRDA